MTHHPKPNAFRLGMATKEVVLLICAICLTLFIISIMSWSLFFACPSYHDRRNVIVDVRNCQQAMRAHQNIHGLKPGDPFTRSDLEEYMQFPMPPLPDHKVTYETRNIITPESADPAVNNDHLWLQVYGKCTKDNVGVLGWENIAETTGW